ncbi:MAG: glycosyltransferase family 2 protein [Planctomycetota bacterium]
MHLSALDAWLLLGGGALALPTLTFAAEVSAALFGRGACSLPRARSPRYAILIPAHDEELGLGETLAGLLDDEDPATILVVADNCSDRTAEVARAAGVRVVERRDPARRGKGYALRAGVEALRAAHPAGPPEVVVLFDADCRASPGALGLVARHAAATGRPIQADYLLRRPPGEGPLAALSELAFLVRNRVRPRGLRALGLPCQLTGSGVALPWSLLTGADLGGGWLTEDLLLGAHLGLAGAPPLSCGDAQVWSELPAGGAAASAQRRRWEHGHLWTAARCAAPLLLRGLTRGRPDLIAQALDLAVPPLSLLLLLWGGLGLLSAAGLACGLGGGPSLALSAAALSILALAVLAAWARFGRARIPASALLRAPLYALAKAPLYARALLAPERRWVRTQRAARPAGHAARGAAGRE